MANEVTKPKRKKTGGRQKGSTNLETRLLKEALLIAAEQVGYNGKGRGGLVGFLKAVAEEDKRTFCAMLGRVIPLQLEAKGDFRFDVTYRSPAEIKREMAARGITKESFARLLDSPDTIDLDDEDYDVIDPMDEVIEVEQ